MPLDKAALQQNLPTLDTIGPRSKFKATRPEGTTRIHTCDEFLDLVVAVYRSGGCLKPRHSLEKRYLIELVVEQSPAPDEEFDFAQDTQTHKCKPGDDTARVTHW